MRFIIKGDEAPQQAKVVSRFVPKTLNLVLYLRIVENSEDQVLAFFSNAQNFIATLPKEIRSNLTQIEIAVSFENILADGLYRIYVGLTFLSEVPPINTSELAESIAEALNIYLENEGILNALPLSLFEVAINVFSNEEIAPSDVEIEFPEQMSIFDIVNLMSEIDSSLLTHQTDAHSFSYLHQTEATKIVSHLQKNENIQFEVNSIIDDQINLKSLLSAGDARYAPYSIIIPDSTIDRIRNQIA